MRCGTNYFDQDTRIILIRRLERCKSKQGLLLGARLEREVIEVAKELCIYEGGASTRGIPFISGKPSRFVIPLNSGMATFK